MTDNDEAIKEFFEVTKQTVKNVFLEKGEFRFAMCFMLDKANRINQVPIPIDEGISKDTVAFIIKDLVRKMQPRALVFVTEAWMAMRPINHKDVPKLMEGRTSVSEQVDKTECIIIVQETPTKSTGVLIPIIKGDKGMYYGEETSGVEMSGRFTHFFRS